MCAACAEVLCQKRLWLKIGSAESLLLIPGEGDKKKMSAGKLLRLFRCLMKEWTESRESEIVPYTECVLPSDGVD